MASSFVIRCFEKILFLPLEQFEQVGQSVGLPLFTQKDLETLNNEARDRFKDQTLLLHLQGPIVAVGDIHGNLFDLIRIIKLTHEIDNIKVVFLGDYVDRGELSVEVISLLFALTIRYPEKYYLLRGNHEFSEVNGLYGFKDQIDKMYGSTDLWSTFNETFAYMPVAAVLNNRIFCVHGGISPNLKNVESISLISRPIYTYTKNRILFDMMWADPTDQAFDYCDSKRGKNQVHDFGINPFQKFLEINHFSKMIRGHECFIAGFNTMFENKLVTVFSCSNYQKVQNNAAILSVDTNDNFKPHILPCYNQIPRSNLKFHNVSMEEKTLLLTQILISPHKAMTAKRRGTMISLKKLSSLKEIPDYTSVTNSTLEQKSHKKLTTSQTSSLKYIGPNTVITPSTSRYHPIPFREKDVLIAGE